MATVYIETTIPSYYHESRANAQITAWKNITRLWWENYRKKYDLCTSVMVLEELARAPASKSQKARKLISNIRILNPLPGLEEVVSYYIDQKLMPTEAGGDAFHLAMASMHGVDFLLTWNCRHLANANKAQHLAVLNGRLRLPVPIITTPLSLMPETGE